MPDTLPGPEPRRAPGGVLAAGRPALSLPRLVATALTIVGVAALAWYLNGAGALSLTSLSGPSGPAPKVGEPAPEFEIELLDGSEVRLSDYRGRVVWVNFWATWCPPCRREMPEMEELAAQYTDAGLTVIGVNLREKQEDVAAYVDRLGLTFDIGLDRDGSAAAEYRVGGLPTHFFIDEHGVLQAAQYGPMDREIMEERLRSVLDLDMTAAGAR